MKKTTQFSFALVLAIFLSACQLLPAKPLAQIEKSPNDARVYQQLVLDNQLQVLLISDPSADKAAAALSVEVGSNGDPETHPGLAHFLEHMLFLGTEKYPSAEEYQEFISSHGGRHNAYTASEETNYFFDINADSLAPTLDRFAQFFVAPLFTEEYVSREVNAVNSEYQLQRKEDGWRGNYARKKLFQSQHPSARFNIGSLETLVDSEEQPLRQALLKFYDQHYSANTMHLVVLGKEDISTLTELVKSSFGDVKNRNLKSEYTQLPLFADGYLPKQLNIKTLKKQRSISYFFPLDDFYQLYRSRPVDYLSNLIGHEGKGSLLSLLKNKGWVEGLVAGAQSVNLHNGGLSVSMILTESGLNHQDDISAALFQYIEVIKQQGIQQWLFNEQKQLAQIAFRFQEKSSPGSYVRHLASKMHQYPVEKILSIPYLWEDYQPKQIQDFLDQLNTDNVSVVVAHQEVATDAIEPWFGTEYSINDISKSRVQTWLNKDSYNELKIPEANPYIAENLDLQSEEYRATIPALLMDNQQAQLWYGQSSEFSIPRANSYFLINNPAIYSSAKNAAMAKLYIRLVNDSLGELTYPAALAGVGYSVSLSHQGLLVSISGYNDKQKNMLDQVLTKLSQLEIKPERFAIYKQQLLRNWANSKQDRPYSQVTAELGKVLLLPQWNNEQLALALENIDQVTLKQFQQELLNNHGVTALIYGNQSSTTAKAMVNAVNSSLPPLATAKLNSDAEPSQKLIRLDAQQALAWDLKIDHHDSSIALYIQGQQQTYEARAYYGLLAQLVKSSFFHELRTQKQLGYVVTSFPYPALRTPGLVFVVQSPVVNPDLLYAHIEVFMKDYASTLRAMSAQEFDQYKQGLINRLLEKPKTLQEQSSRFWTELRTQEMQFDSKQQIADAMAAISHEKFMSFYQEWLQQWPQHSLAIRSLGNGHLQQDKPQTPITVISDVEVFRATDNGYFSLQSAVKTAAEG